MLLQKLDRGKRAACYRWGQRVRKELRTRALREHITQRRRGGDESAGGTAECFAERRRDDVHFAEHSEMLRRASPGFAKYARRMRIIHREHGVVAPGDLDQL